MFRFHLSRIFRTADPRPSVLAIAVGCACFSTVVHGDGRCVPSAHRGERSKAFDNSVEALRASVGLPYVEIDIRVTVDNELPLFHDRRLSATNFRGPQRLIGRPVSSLSQEELASIRFPDGSRIPRLRTALREVEGRRITLMLDVKSTSPRDFRRVVEAVYEVNAQSRVVVQCQSKDLVAFMKREFPEVAVLARAHHETEVRELLAYSPQFLQIDHDWDLEGVIPLIHGRGSRVVVKTLAPETDRPEVWKRLCGVGVDVVLTDKPRDFITSGPFGPPSESAESNSEKEPGA